MNYNFVIEVLSEFLKDYREHYLLFSVDED